VVVLVGGAAGLTPNDTATCERIIGSALVPAIEETGAVLVDGGTNTGIMRIAGRARQRAGAQCPHVGVVAEGTVRWPNHLATNDDAADLEPHHTHIAAVPGDHWGDETLWISTIAAALCGNAPSVTVLANGGRIAYNDVQHSIDAGRPVLVLNGTGRTAARIGEAMNGQPTDPQAVRLARSTLLTALPNDLNLVSAALAAALGRPP
jgi:hypothetical protein